MRGKIKLDAKGLEEAATSADMHRAIDALAEQVAGNARGQGVTVGDFRGNAQIALPVKTYTGRTATTNDMRIDRAHAYVSLAHPAGLAVQAKHGTLTKAAAQAGLKVKG